MRNQRIIIAILIVSGLILAGASIYFLIKSQTPTNSTANSSLNTIDALQASIIQQLESGQTAVLGISTSQSDIPIQDSQCKNIFSSAIFQLLKNEPSYSALSQIGWSTLSIKDLGAGDNISLHCQYTFLGNTELDLTIHTSASNETHQVQNSIVAGNIGKAIDAGVSSSSPYYNFSFGQSKSDPSKCSADIFDQQSKFKYLELRYLNSMNCSDKKNINLNQALFKILSSRLSTIVQ